MLKKKIWINWETHRRSYELSRALNLPYYCIDYEGHILRYPISLIKTLIVLMRNRPRVLVVQNPSMILSALACIYRYLFSSFLIVDRHTTFRLNKPHKGSFRIWLFMTLHYWTLRNADVTIVTNDYLAALVKKNGGTPFVLPDKLPVFDNPIRLDLSEYPFNLLMISSFGQDEPISEVFEAMSQLEADHNIRLFVSGNYKKSYSNLLESRHNNVKLTGFLSEEEYINLLVSVEGVLVLTTSDYCMLCGCYEATAVEKPFITSKKKVLEDYFYDAVHVENNAKEIAAAIVELMRNSEKHRLKIKRMRKVISKSWEERFCKLVGIIAEK